MATHNNTLQQDTNLYQRTPRTSNIIDDFILPYQSLYFRCSMISVEIIALVLTGVGLIASIIYYANTLQNANKTQEQQLAARRTQVCTALLQGSMTEEAMQRHIELLETQFTDFDDFLQKYDSSVNPELAAKRLTTWWRYNTIGYMIKDDLIDASTVYNFIGPASMLQWRKWKPIIEEYEKTGLSTPGIYEGFDYLYTEMDKIRQQRGHGK